MTAAATLRVTPSEKVSGPDLQMLLAIFAACHIQGVALMRIGANTDRPPFELAPRTTLAGHLAMIVSWWWDDEPALESASLGIALIPDLLLGQTDDFEINEWLIFAAALGAFYPRTPELEEIHALAVRGFKGELGIGRTKCFLNKETTAAAYMERPVNSRC